MHQILQKNLTKIQEVCKRQNIEKLYAFGSVCTDKFNENSDIDLLVSFSPMDFADYTESYFATIEEFERLFQRPVDLLTEKSLQNPYLIRSINQSKQVLYAG